MSPRRSILLILLGGALVAGLLTIIMRIASHAPAVSAFVLFSAISILALYSGIRGLKRGTMVINTKGCISVYERHSKPFGFWLYFLIFILLSLVFLAVAIYLLLTLPMTR